MPEGVDLYGLYNKVTDWDAVRAAGIEFAWVKLSDGNTNREDYGYVAAGRRVGVAMGGYHYAQPGDPVAQANRLLDRCAVYGALDLAPALDLEDPFVPGPAAAAFAIAFLLQVETRGHVPCLYANQSMLLGILPAVRKAVPNVRVWGARYGAALTMLHDVHQYTSTGRVAGIAGDVDRNRGSIIRNTAREGNMSAGIDNDDVGVIMRYGAIKAAYLAAGGDPKDADLNRDYVRLYELMSADPVAILRAIKDKVDGLAVPAAPEIDYAKLAAALGDSFADVVADKLADRLKA